MINEKNNLDKALRETLGSKGKIFLSIKADNTDGNAKIHQEFKDFCVSEADNVYTIGLKLLLEAYKQDFKFSLLYDKLSSLEVKYEELSNNFVDKPVKVKSKSEVF